MNFDLKTDRLQLHLIMEVDYENIHFLHSFPEVDRFNTTGIPNSLEETISIMASFVTANQKIMLNASEVKDRCTFAIHTKEDDKFIGLVGLFLGKEKYKSAEVWYKFIPESWGKGYATEMLTEMISFCFNTLQLHRLEAGCAIENVGSVRVMEKVGMQLEGRRRQTLPLAEGWSDNFEYAILDSDR